MTDKDITQVNAFFNSWKGAVALFNKFTASHNRFIIELKQPDSGEFIGVSFSFCNYIAGPTWWDNCDLKCNRRMEKMDTKYETKWLGFLLEEQTQ